MDFMLSYCWALTAQFFLDLCLHKCKEQCFYNLLTVLDARTQMKLLSENPGHRSSMSFLLGKLSHWHCPSVEDAVQISVKNNHQQKPQWAVELESVPGASLMDIYISIQYNLTQTKQQHRHCSERMRTKGSSAHLVQYYSEWKHYLL